MDVINTAPHAHTTLFSDLILFNKPPERKANDRRPIFRHHTLLPSGVRHRGAHRTTLSRVGIWLQRDAEGSPLIGGKHITVHTHSSNVDLFLELVL